LQVGGQSASSALYTLHILLLAAVGTHQQQTPSTSTRTAAITNDQRRKLLAPEIAPGWLIALMIALSTATHSATEPSSEPKPESKPEPEPEPFGLAEVKLSRVAGAATTGPLHRFDSYIDCRGHVVMLPDHWLHQFCNCCRRASRGRQKGLRYGYACRRVEKQVRHRDCRVARPSATDSRTHAMYESCQMKAA
jgi:hypothetical protein